MEHLLGREKEGKGCFCIVCHLASGQNLLVGTPEGQVWRHAFFKKSHDIPNDVGCPDAVS